MKDKISIGDIVAVNFNCSKFTLYGRAQVLHLPQATGDSWRFKDMDSGVIAYVSEGCTIIKISDGEP